MRPRDLTDLLWRGFGILVVLFMLAPLFLVILFSFNESASPACR
jgi:ABC-type spermidine/putrescine transport system permease subunit II